MSNFDFLIFALSQVSKLTCYRNLCLVACNILSKRRKRWKFFQGLMLLLLYIYFHYLLLVSCHQQGISKLQLFFKSSTELPQKKIIPLMNLPTQNLFVVFCCFSLKCSLFSGLFRILVINIRWEVGQKQLTAFNCYLFLQDPPSQMFDRVLNILLDHVSNVF